MKPQSAIFNVLIILFSFQVVLCDDLKNFELKLSSKDNIRNFEELNQSFLKEWGTINSNSVIVGLTTHYLKTFDEGTIAIWNVTFIKSRTMHGIRMRSSDTVASAEIIRGGIGFSFAIFTVVGHSNTLNFAITAFETPPIIFREWGTINNASLVLFPEQVFIRDTEDGEILHYEQRISRTRIIHGIRLISSLNSIAHAEVTEGGIGFDFVAINITSHTNLLSYSITPFENGTNIQSTTVSFTTSIPETRVKILGRIDSETQFLDAKRFENYPQPGITAEGNGSFEVSGIIIGIRLTSLNFTDGLLEIIESGLNQSSVTFSFKGADVGRPYDFKIEIYGNSAAIVNLSIILFILSKILYNIF